MTSCCPRAGEREPFGRERYVPNSRQFLGATIDIDETYAWGQEELARIVTEMEQTADRIKAGASVPEAIEFLDNDSSRHLEGTDALQAWMQTSVRRRRRRAGRFALRHPRADPRARVPHRAHHQRRRLLHRAQRRPGHPSRTDVVVGAEGRDVLRHVEGTDDRLPRGRARPSPADRADRVPARPAQQLAPARLLDERATARAGRSTPSS